MPFAADPVALSEEEKIELEQITQSRTLPSGDVMRARMILLLAKGVSYQEIMRLLDTTAPTISRWKGRCLERFAFRSWHPKNTRQNLFNGVRPHKQAIWLAFYARLNSPAAARE